ncbi:hypothetical protein NDU88_001514 [Pleurodeles waltl]|uniref:Uncharacterized protein n=1 Tax=Pleurodeles waltl TaxID=8319 RepID=A0AAV7SZI9_PLEWA|nr:hypothetical protein NDU88_001514 [Pleurodeles waltl]
MVAWSQHRAGLVGFGGGSARVDKSQRGCVSRCGLSAALRARGDKQSAARSSPTPVPLTGERLTGPAPAQAVNQSA